MEILEDYAQYVTVTAQDWKPIIKDRAHKEIVTESLRFLVENKRIYLYAFVIMDNHIHLIWHIRAGHKMTNVQRDFLKYTAQQIKFSLMANNPELLENMKTKGADRKYQFWQRNSLSVPLYSAKVFQQKLEYIHQNPVKAGLANKPWEYHYSSAAFYHIQSTNFSFLSHHDG
ncbi:REP-associated tyrosine transposase [Marinoscillum sp.]|uniref:REP-associated tyrosine transposase n=1 Tax=Marinoscillum sp. TaxID=2024838 RepID=UPI003BABD598